MPRDVELCSLDASYAFDPQFGAIANALCRAKSEMEAKLKEVGGDRDKLPELRLPDIQIGNLTMPIRLKEPTVKYRDGTRIVEMKKIDGSDGYEIRDKDGNVVETVAAKTSDGIKKGENLDSPDKVKASLDANQKFIVPTEDGDVLYRVKSTPDGNILVKDTGVRPLTLAGRTVLVVDLLETLLDLTEYGVWEDPTKLVDYAKDVADAIGQYGDEIVQAVQAGDVEFLENELIDQVNLVGAVDNVFRRIDEHDLPYVDDAVHVIHEGLSQADELVTDFSHSGAATIREDMEGRPFSVPNPVVEGAKVVTDFIDDKTGIPSAVVEGAKDLGSQVVNAITDTGGKVVDSIRSWFGW